MSPFISTPGIESNLMNIVSSPMPSNHSNQIPSSRKYYDEYQEHSDNGSFRAMEISHGAATGLIDDPWSSSSSFGTMMHNYTNNGTRLPLPLEQISFHIEKHSADDCVDNILKLISPTAHDRETQKAVSRKLFSMFTEDLAVAHICNIESTALGTFLPNEPISISVFLFSDEDEAKLLDVQRTLCDYILLNTSIDLNKSENGGSAPKTGQPNSNSLRSLNIMKVSHVSTTRTADNNLELKCNIDGSDVIIKKNSLSSLYLSAMIEEADQIIGKHHLVKQGLILVRSWCKMECQSYWGGLNLTLSDESIFVVILYIFNVYHARLHFPLQVLATFLYVMSSFKWDEHALTINGPIETRGRAAGHLVDFDNDNSNNGMNNENETIFSEKFVHRYRSNYEECIKFTEVRGEGNRKSGSISSTSSSEEERYVSGEKNNIGSATRSQFCVTPINIISPLDLSDNVTEYIKKDNAMKLYSAFCQGARGLNQLMKFISQDYDDLYHRTWPSSRSSASNFVSNSARSIQDRVESCFTNILKAHQHRKNTHIQEGPSLWEPQNVAVRSDIYLSDACKDGDTVLLLYTDGFSGSQLMKVTKNILQEKGPLAVGEIGKLLKEKLPNSHLSSILKEKFGGLKKFIEQFYGDEFLLGTNHKFNPKVYLRKALTGEEIELIKNGTDISKKSKNRKSRGRNKKKRQGYDSKRAQRIFMNLIK